MKETNMEHYRGEIEEANYTFSICNGEVIKGCSSFYCSDCGFSRAKNEDNRRCTERKLKWLMSPYKPEPVLTEREKHFVEFAQEGWLARDSDGKLFAFKEKPRKDPVRWDGQFGSYTLVKEKFWGQLFPFITWVDEEPWAVEDLRKLKVGDQDA